MKTHIALNRILVLAALLVGLVLTHPAPTEAQEKKPPKVTYDDHVKPLLRQKCFSCHNADKHKGDLDMTNYTNLLLGGGSGEVVEPGDSSGSYLYQLITHSEEPFMPPESPKVSAAMIETIRKWIDGGVLENLGSVAAASKKPKFNLALKSTTLGKPAVPPMPARLSLEPVTLAKKTTAVSAIATNPWSPVAAVAGQKQVLLYHTKTLRLLGVLPFPEGVPLVLKFSRNGSLLLAGGGRGGASGRVVVWNLKSGQRVIEIGDELDVVLAADISNDQRLIALGGPQKVVRIYSTETGRLVHELRKHTDWIHSLEFSPDGVLLASGDRAGGLFVWEAWTGREYLTLKGHGASVTGVSWRSDSNVLASCSDDSTIRLWEMENGGQIKNWGAHGGGTASVEFARDGRILSCGRDRVAKLWDQNGKQQRAFEAFGDLALRVSFCDETNRAIAGDWTGTIRVWNAADGKRIGELLSNPPALAARLDAASKQSAADQAALKPLAAAYQAAASAAAKARADLAAAQKVVTDQQKRSAAATAAAGTAKQALTQATAAQQAASKAVTDLEGAVAVLNEASAKAQAAAAKLKGDEEIAAAAAQVKAVADRRAATLATNRKVLTENTAALAGTKTQVATAGKTVIATAAALKAASEQAAKLTPLLKPANDKATVAKKAAAAAATTAAASGQEVARWQDEIAFAQKLKALAQHRDKAFEQLAARQADHQPLLAAARAAQSAAERANGDLAKAQSAAAAAQRQVDSATSAASGAKTATNQATAAHLAATQAMSAFQAVLAPLGEAAAKAKEAAAKSGGDKQLAAVANELKRLADARTAQLDAAGQDVVAKAKLIEVANQKQLAAAKAITVATTALDAACKRAAEMIAAAKPASAKAAATKKAAEGAASAVAAAQKEVDHLGTEIATAQGLD